jgi:NhaP-type Na+/H+ or K+/H+ antiporter
MGTLLGFALGYYLGTKAGPNGIEDLLKAWRTIQESEDYQALAATVSATLASAMEQGQGAVANLISGLTSAGGGIGASQLIKLAGTNGNLNGVWETITKSAEVQGFMSTGAAMVMQWMERGATAARDRMQ